MPKIKVLSQKNILRANLFDVKQSEILLQNGKKEIWQDIFLKPVTLILPFTDADEIYMISQYRPLLNGYELEVVAGYVNDGEEPLAAAKRELEEETGLTASHWQTLGTYNL